MNKSRQIVPNHEQVAEIEKEIFWEAAFLGDHANFPKGTKCSSMLNVIQIENITVTVCVILVGTTRKVVGNVRSTNMVLLLENILNCYASKTGVV